MKQYLLEIYTIWYRDVLRFWRNKARVATSFSFPILWLAVFGTGISSSLSLPIQGVNFIQFLFPGVLCQYLIFNSMFSAISILQDREFGFLKEILVSPARRSAIALGKVLGGASTTWIQVMPVILLGPVVGVHFSWQLLIVLPLALALLAIALTSFGVAIVSRMKTLDAGQYVFQFIAFPLIMISGALFPLRNLPAWLHVVSEFNPFTYAVDFVRRIDFIYSYIPVSAQTALSPEFRGSILPLQIEFLITLVFALVMIWSATRAFRHL